MKKKRSLLELRLAAKLTQAQLAMRCGVPRQRVSRWERSLCQPRLHHAMLLAQGLGVTLEVVACAAEEGLLNKHFKPQKMSGRLYMVHYPEAQKGQ